MAWKNFFSSSFFFNIVANRRINFGVQQLLAIFFSLLNLLLQQKSQLINDSSLASSSLININIFRFFFLVFWFFLLLLQFQIQIHSFFFSFYKNNFGLKKKLFFLVVWRNNEESFKLRKRRRNVEALKGKQNFYFFLKRQTAEKSRWCT